MNSRVWEWITNNDARRRSKNCGLKRSLRKRTSDLNQHVIIGDVPGQGRVQV